MALKIMVLKRNGNREQFVPGKLYESIRLAASGTGLEEPEIDDLFRLVRLEILEEEKKEITSSLIADRVVRLMMERGVYNPKWFEAAKRYELARIYNDVYGKGNWKDFDPVDLRLTFNAIKVLEARYLLKEPESGRFKETPKMMFRRVARFLASVEKRYGASEQEIKYWEEEFFRIMSELKFIPNSPTLMNSETRLGILSACFVIPVRDSMTTPKGEGIMDAVRAQALIFQHGGGTGFDFSELRPEGDVVTSSGGRSSGPLSFMKLFDLNTEVIKQGGKRRGANMGVMHIWHPDIKKFIKAKTGTLKDVNLQNFNISVGVYDWFMRAVENGEKIPLINPRKTDLSGVRDSRYYAVVRARHSLSEEWVQEVIIDELEKSGGSIGLDKSIIITWDEALEIAKINNAITEWIDARELFSEITKGAWDSGDPGMLFMDTINRRHPVWYLGKIHATNPCGEEPLLDWENCNLGSINLERYVVESPEGPTIDWEGLARDIRTAVRFLDNVIDANRHPLPQITKANLRTRKVGLGVMGWARMLIKLGMPYDSVDAIYLAWYLAEWIAWNAYSEGVELAREKGPFPAWNFKLYRWLFETIPFKSPKEALEVAEIKGEPSEKARKIINSRPPTNWEGVKRKAKIYGLRNAAYLSIAPTGSISIIAGTSSSIEPLFALAFIRNVSVGTFLEVDPLFIEELRKLEIDEPEVLETIAETGSVTNIKWIPRRLRRLYRTAHDIDPEWHLLHQATWQVWIDAAVSKTVNLRHDEPPETVWKVYVLAWKLGAKGVTIYRDRSKSEQVIYFGVKKEKEEKEEPIIKTEKEEIRPVLIINKDTEKEKEKKEVQKELIKNIQKGAKINDHETRLAPGRSKVRLGNGKIKELLVVAEEYAGGCPTCDI